MKKNAMSSGGEERACKKAGKMKLKRIEDVAAAVREILLGEFVFFLRCARCVYAWQRKIGTPSAF